MWILSSIGIPAHHAVGLAGSAYRLVPSCSRPALTLRPPAVSAFAACALRLPWGSGVRWVGELAAPFNVPRYSHCQGLRALPCGWSLASWRPRLRTLTSALQRAGASLGQPASAELENATVYYVPSEPTSVMKVSPIFPTIGIHNRVQ